MSDPSPVSGTSPQVFWRDSAWRAVAAAFGVNGLLFGVWASRIPAFKEGFDLAPGTLGVLLLAMAGGAIVSFPFAGAMSERWGSDRLTVRCAWAYSPALILLALAPNIATLGVALFVFGALHGAMDVAMNGWGARVEERLRRPTMSIFHAMFSLGAGLGALSGFAAVSVGLDPLGHFCLVAVLGGAAALLAMIPAQEPRVPAQESSGPVLALPSGALVLVGLIAFAVSMGEGAMADWSAVFLRTAVEASEAQAALGYAGFSTAMVLTRLSGGFVVQHFGPTITTRLSGMIAFAGLAIATLTDSTALALLGFTLAGVGYAVVMPLVFSRAAQDRTMRPGPAIASVATLGYGGMLLGPPIVGFIAEFFGLRVSFGVLALLALLAVFLAPCLRADARQPTLKARP